MENFEKLLESVTKRLGMFEELTNKNCNISKYNRDMLIYFWNKLKDELTESIRLNETNLKTFLGGLVVRKHVITENPTYTPKLRKYMLREIEIIITVVHQMAIIEDNKNNKLNNNQ